MSQTFRALHLICYSYSVKFKGKAIPVQAWTGFEISKRLRLPVFKRVGTWRWYGSQPYVPPAFTLQEMFLGGSHGHSMAGWIMSMEGPNETIGNRTRDLPACSKVPPVSSVQWLNVGWLEASHRRCEKTFSWVTNEVLMHDSVTVGMSHSSTVIISKTGHWSSITTVSLACISYWAFFPGLLVSSSDFLLYLNVLVSILLADTCAHDRTA